MSNISSTEIRGQIDALDALVTSLGLEFDGHAEMAVAGDADAAKRASQIDDRLARLATERKILARAFERSEAAERASILETERADRERHMSNARSHAERLFEISELVDQAVAVLAEALPSLSMTESALKRSLHAAKHDFSTGVIGRNGVQVLAMDALLAITDGRRHMRGPGKPIRDTVTTAWAFLTEEQNDE